MFTVFSFGFFYIPTVKVKFRSIIIGAACSSITWILFKSLFNWYVVHLTNIELLWGVLASLPIFLFWIYSTWVIMLSGITIVSILENRHIPVKSDIPSRKLRITIEKSINKDEMIKLSTPTLLNKDDVKEILTDIFTEFSKKNTLDNKETKKIERKMKIKSENKDWSKINEENFDISKINKLENDGYVVESVSSTPCGCGGCDICKIFGPHNSKNIIYPRRAIVRDAFLVNEKKDEVLTKKTIITMSTLRLKWKISLIE